MVMKYNKILVLMLAFLFGKLAAQQLPQYSQYLLNDYAVNPAVAGSRPFYEAKANNRNQWVGVTDAPRTFILSVQGPFRSKNVGLGGNIYTDITGPTRRIGFNVNYAYHLKVSGAVKLSLSLSGGLMQFSIDGSKVTTRDPGDPYFSNQMQSVLTPDFGFGMYLYHDKFYVGFSAPQLTQNKISFFVNDHRLSKLEDHYFFTGGYRFNIGSDLKVEPSVLVKYVSPAPPQFDFNTRVIYQEKVWLGSSLRMKDAFSALIGYMFQDNLMIGYSYDYTLSGLRKYSSGTHELMLGMRFLPNKKRNQSLIP